MHSHLMEKLIKNLSVVVILPVLKRYSCLVTKCDIFAILSLRKLVPSHFFTEIFFSEAKIDNFIGNFLIYLIYLFNTYIVGTLEPPRQNRIAEAVLTSTHNVCFGSKIRILGIPSFSI